jgi:septal ring factor EnvC (AmiA/AmiB activator)
MSGWQGDDGAPVETRPTWSPRATTTAAPPVETRGSTTSRRRRRRWPVVVTIVVLVLAVLATAALAAHLWRTTDAWQAETERVEGVAAELQAERDRLAGELDQARRDLAATEEQLHRAQERVTELAEEKAQTADEREVARQLAGTAATVATQLETCVRGQDQLITALADIAAYDPQAVVEYAETVRTACNEALRGNEEIQRIVGQ